ncbi:hypothetical protein [Pelagibacterium luteolum]|uniref:Uncharacterized protein n=1 Tax=Pelagibacterium luteolum TaxID=440168 RepID=A0A1G7ZIC6_9HYPH|nr:hypothetical protein [Pelagibacterium luteolum]SDH08458.1 hypothetical protein SAMN04487974_12036 [Pelagibacterium luteolum]
MATDRLRQYNGALQMLGQTRIANLSVNEKSRRELDAAWDEANEYMLSKGLWNFAIRSSEMAFDDDVEPVSGYRYAIKIPDDFVRIVTLSATGFADQEMERYQNENGYWFCDYSEAFLRYVSYDAEYGMDLGKWPPAFALAHQAYLAFKSGLPVTGDKGTRNDVWGLHKRLLSEAKVSDAIEQPVARRPAGRWARARYGRHGSQR